MQTAAPVVLLIYIVVLVIGGFVGWRVSGSRISLTASLVSAALLSIAYRLSRTSPAEGYLTATIIAVAIEVMFALRLRKTKKFMPSGMLLVLTSVVVVILAWTTVTSWSS